MNFEKEDQAMQSLMSRTSLKQPQPEFFENYEKEVWNRISFGTSTFLYPLIAVGVGAVMIFAIAWFLGIPQMFFRHHPQNSNVPLSSSSVILPSSSAMLPPDASLFEEKRRGEDLEVVSSMKHPRDSSPVAQNDKLVISGAAVQDQDIEQVNRDLMVLELLGENDVFDNMDRVGNDLEIATQMLQASPV